MTLRLLLIPTLLLSACDQRAPCATTAAPADARAQAIASEQAKDDKIMDNARIAALQKQVNDLAAELSEVRDGREAIDTRLIEQRLTAVEQRVYAHAPRDAAAPVQAAAPRSSSTATPRPSPTASPRAPLKLSLPAADR